MTTEAFSPEVIAETVTSFLDAWSTRDQKKREGLIARTCTESVFYCDPLTRIVGRDALSGRIGELIVEAQPSRLIRTTEIDIHHEMIRFGWVAFDSNGKAGLSGVDSGRLAEDRKFSFIIGFFGPLRSRTYAFGQTKR